MGKNYIITESQYNKSIDKFITYQFEPHEEKKNERLPKSLFWVKDGEAIAEIDDLNYFWIKYSIFKNILSMFSLEKEETIIVMKRWLEKHYGLGHLTPRTITKVYNYER